MQRLHFNPLTPFLHSHWPVFSLHRIGSSEPNLLQSHLVCCCCSISLLSGSSLNELSCDWSILCFEQQKWSWSLNVSNVLIDGITFRWYKHVWFDEHSRKKSDLLSQSINLPDNRSNCGNVPLQIDELLLIRQFFSGWALIFCCRRQASSCSLQSFTITIK